MPVKIEPIVASLPDTVPFVAPEETERANGARFKARLGANEGNFGAAPAAIKAIQEAARNDVWRYSDPTYFELREALCTKLGLSEEELVCGPGIDGLLGLIVRIFSAPGDVIVTSLGAYPTFNYHVHAYGRELEAVPYRGFHEDLDALARRALELKASIVYLSNPDNPMGTWWDARSVEAFFDAVPEDTLIILDEAYGETAPVGTLTTIDTTRANVIRVRTFSKAYGLAGLRVGYAFGHSDLIRPFHRVRDHFGVNIMAQKAALASLKSQEWLAQTVHKIALGREQIAQIAHANGLVPIASATNFVTLECGAGADYASGLLHRLSDWGIFIRKPMAPGIDHCIRVSVGRDDELAAFAKALPEAL
ncbi:MAG: pyridoxal phosphate-dependent aminotransferase [Pseudomonadota bacterium]